MPGTITMTLTGQGLEVVHRLPTFDRVALVRTVAQSAMGVFVEHAKAKAPRRSGKLAGALGYQSRILPNGIELQSRALGVAYAKFVVDGTGIHHRPAPHSEWTVNKYQRFVAADGSVVHTMRTHHKGQKPNDFEMAAVAALQAVMPAITATGGQRLVRWIRGAAA